VNKEAISLIISILLFMTVISAEEFFSDSVRSNDIVSANNKTIEVTLSSENIAYITYGNQSMIIPEGECRTKGNTEFCIGTIEFLHRNYTTFENIYETTLDVNHLDVLDFNKTISDDEIAIGETTDISIIIRNTGNTIMNIAFNDTYPTEKFTISNVEGCGFNEKTNVIDWTGTMPPNARVRCSYTVQGEEPTTYKSTAAVWYDDGEVQESIGRETTLKVKNNSLKVTTSFNNTKIKIGDALNVTVTLENINEEEIEVNEFTIAFSNGIKLFELIGDGRKDSGKIKWEGTLAADEKKEIAMQLQFTHRGDANISAKQKYKEGNFLREFDSTATIPVGCDCPRVDHSNINNLKAGEEIPLRIVLHNPSRTQKFSNVKITHATSIPQLLLQQISTTTIPPNDEIVLVNEKIYVPEKTSYYNVTVEYTTEFDQLITESTSIMIKSETTANESIIAEKAEPKAIENKTEVKGEVNSTQVQQPQETSTPKTGTITGIVVIVFIAIAVIAIIKLLMR